MIVTGVPMVVVVAERRRPRVLEVAPGLSGERLWADQHPLRVLQNEILMSGIKARVVKHP